MPTELQSAARYLAYRWYRNRHLGAAHGKAWEFARENWEKFLDRAERRVRRHQPSRSGGDRL